MKGVFKIKYNSKYKILFKTCPPIPWSGFHGINTAWYEYDNTVKYDKDIHSVNFIFNGKNYNSLIKYINKFKGG